MNISLSKGLDTRFKKIGIKSIYLFGSQTTPFRHKESDVDIGILFHEDYPKDKDTARSELYDRFSSLFKSERVDIVFLQESPLRLQFTVVTEGKLLYTSDIEKSLNYEEEIRWKYLDFVPILREFDKAVLEAKRK
ncbi:MAG: nucleotidyltransferase domain-containing protein [bacterium]